MIKLEQLSQTTSTRDLGEFTINSNAIRFTDPCYDNDTWCKGSLPALNGKWQAKLGFFRNEMDARDYLLQIDKYTFIKDFNEKFKNDGSAIDNFTDLVWEARDHSKHSDNFQKIQKLFELIELIEDVSIKSTFIEMATYSITR